MSHGLQALDLGSSEEAVYGWLVGAGLSSLSQISRGARIPLAQARTAVATLERRGAVARASGRPARFSASPPELALEALVVEREQALDAARLEVKRLQERYRQAASRRNPAELAEIVEGRDAVRQRVEQLWRSPREEVLVFDKPPYAIPPAEVIEGAGSMPIAGVAFKTIYSSEALERPEALVHIEQFVKAGEQARFFPSLPMKLNLFDRRVALIPLAEQQGSVEAAIIVHSSHLVEALLALWDSFWERAFPLPLGEATSAAAHGGAPLSSDQARLVTLLLSGITSQAMARQMNLGLSTVERRISGLMTELGVKTRFQAGYEVARRRYVTDQVGPPQTRPSHE